MDLLLYSVILNWQLAVENTLTILARRVSLFYKLQTTAKVSDDLSNGFPRDGSKRQQELINNENLKGKYHLRIMLKDVFGLAEHHEKATFGLVYKLT